MVLPFLPAQDIKSMFIGIEYLVPPNGKMSELINYVCQTWIELKCKLPLLDSEVHQWRIQIFHCGEGGTGGRN